MIGAANSIPLFVIFPLTGAFLVSILGRHFKHSADRIGVMTTMALVCTSFFAIQAQKTYGTLVYSVGAWKPPIGIAMVMDGLTVLMLVMVNVIACAVTLYAVNYMEQFTAKWKFYTLFLLMIGGMNGVIITGDIFNLFVFLEIASLASFSLVAFGTESHELEAAFKYAVINSVGALFILLAIALLYSYTSTLNMADMALMLIYKGHLKVVVMASALFLVGFGVKAAFVPFHAWLPDAHPSAPAPISAMLSGVLIKSLGIYTLCRIFYNVIGMDAAISSIIMFLGMLSMVVGILLAMSQWDLKRLLACSSISQIGYIALGIGLGTPLGIFGALFHLLNHSVFKSLLFLNAGAVEYATGTRDMQKLGGLMKKMPVTGATNLIGSLSIAGIPPLSGFWSKLIIIIALIQAGRTWYAFWAVLVSILTLSLYLRVMKHTYFGNAPEQLASVKEVPIFMRVSMGFLALLCIIGGVLMVPELKQAFLFRAVDTLKEGIGYALVVLRNI